MNVAAIILAAGQSSRFKRGNKLLTLIDGVALIRRVALAASRSRASEIALVAAPGGQDLIAAAGDGPWRAVIAHDADKGLSASLGSGIASLSPAVDGAAVVLADMPGMSTQLIDRMITAFEQHRGDTIVFPRGNGENERQGHPVVWPKSFFRDLQGLSGDTGAKALLAQYSDRCLAVTTDDPGAYFDVDREEDLAGHGWV